MIQLEHLITGITECSFALLYMKEYKGYSSKKTTLNNTFFARQKCVPMPAN